ncbi:MAG: sensor histidine kinase [Bacteroidetes bacterium]|nr:MAG: sensor histidine kinase [Bacteroidota bacterium]
MFKNQSPQQLTFWASLSSSAAITILILVLSKLTGLFDLSWIALALVFGLVFVVSFLGNYFFIRYYIFRKIKLIYKIIHRHKLPTDFKADKVKMGDNIFDEIDEEVNQWARARTRELDELEKLATYRRQFIGDVSHELKTPIFNIQGFIHTLLDGAIDDPEVNIKYLKRAGKNIERLQAIVEDLETINKIESGQMILDLREFDIRELTDEVFADLELKARERKIKLTYKEGANQHFRVRADKESIRQVLINLVQNSIKYGREGGTTKVSFYDMASYILLEVSDNGIGVTPQDLPHVFDRFFRVDKSRSRDAGGTGLGLSIVKHIMEAHKQTINVRSTYGQGSTFGLTLEKA